MFFRFIGCRAAFLSDFPRLFQKRPLPFSYTLTLFLTLFSLSISAQRSAADDVTLPDVGDPPVESEIGSEVDATARETAVKQTAATHFVYLPMVVNPPSCALNSQEQEIADLARAHPNQGRAVMNCSSILSQVARAKAQDMAMRQFFGHTNPDGEGPNHLVKEAGYRLPTWYNSSMDGNNIESIAAGYTTAAAAWEGWMNSSGHRTHLLAESSFWADQTNFGVGYYYDASSPYKHYWVFISAPPES